MVTKQNVEYEENYENTMWKQIVTDSYQSCSFVSLSGVAGIIRCSFFKSNCLLLNCITHSLMEIEPTTYVGQEVNLKLIKQKFIYTYAFVTTSMKIYFIFSMGFSNTISIIQLVRNNQHVFCFVILCKRERESLFLFGDYDTHTKISLEKYIKSKSWSLVRGCDGPAAVHVRDRHGAFIVSTTSH